MWGKRVAVEVKVDTGGELRREIEGVRKALGSLALSELFVLVGEGKNTPTEIVRLTGKSKFVVSLQLSSLKKVGLLKDRSVVGWDLRRKRYEVVWDRVAQIFRQDHALELEIYENHLLVEPMREIRGIVKKAGLAITGSGKLGLVKEVAPEQVTMLEGTSRHVYLRMNRLVWEFVELFKGYLKERRYPTLRGYFLGAYEELSEHYGRLPKNSELAMFFEFTDRSFARTQPIEQVWRKHVGKPLKDAPILYWRSSTRALTLKLFAEAGSVDPAGRYLLNAEAQGAIKPGTALRIYPSYTYPEL